MTIDDGEKVRPWRASLDKYSTLPGIRNLHDFVFARNPGCNVRMKARRLCYKGLIQDSDFRVKRGHSLEESAIPTETYKSTGQIRQITDTKLGHIRQMCDSFIPSERHMNILS